MPAWKRLTTLLASLAFLLCAAAHPAPAQSRDDEPDMIVDLGWGKTLIAGRWNPVRIHVVGASEAVSGRLVISTGAGTVTTGAVTIPFVATPFQTIPFDATFIPPPMTWFGADQRWISVAMYRNGRARPIRVREWRSMPRPGDQSLIALPYTEDTCLIVASGESSLRAASTRWGTSASNQPATTSIAFDEAGSDPWDSTITTSVPPASLTSSHIAWDSAAIAVIQGDDIDAVPADAREAILQWVERGGRLLLLLDDAAPDLRRWLGEPHFDIQLTPPDAAAGRPAIQRFVLREDARRRGWTTTSPVNPEVPDWVASGPRGLGLIAVLATDPADLLPAPSADATPVHPDAPPTDEPEVRALANAWIEVLQPLRDGIRSEQYNWYGNDSQATLSRRAAFDQLVLSLQAGRAFPFLIIVGFALLFILCVSLVDGLLARRLHLSAWAWAVATGWLALFTAVAWLVPTLVRSEDSQWRRLALLDAAPHLGVAWQEGVAGFYSATSQRVRIDDDAGWWRAIDVRQWSNSINSPAIKADQPGRNVPDSIPVNVWTFLTLADERPVPVEGLPSVIIEPAGPDRFDLRITLPDPGILRGVVIWTAGGFRIDEDPKLGADDWSARPRRVIDVAWYRDAAHDSDHRFWTATSPYTPGVADLTSAAVSFENACLRARAMKRYVDTGRWAVVALHVDEPRLDFATPTTGDVQSTRIIRLLLPLPDEDALP